MAASRADRTVPMDRDDTLKRAEKLLRQGRLDAAIAEYARVVDEFPRDWNTTNLLGDLHARAGQSDRAVAQFTRIAEHLAAEGFLPKASAVYKKCLKVRPDDEHVLRQLGELAAQQGLVADARQYLGAVIDRRRACGDRAAVAELLVRLASVDPSDVDLQLRAAGAAAEAGNREAAGRLLRELASEYEDQERGGDAVTVLEEALRLDPGDQALRRRVVHLVAQHGHPTEVGKYLTVDTAGDDPDLLRLFGLAELCAGRAESGRAALERCVQLSPAQCARVASAASGLPNDGDAAFVCVDVVGDVWVGQGDYQAAADALREYVSRVPNHVPALMKLVEVCVDGGLESTMYEAQAQLADAYLTAGRAAEARVIAEDLVARDPDDPSNGDRYRRALVMLGEPDPDRLVSEHLNGDSPFVSTADLLDEEPLDADRREAPEGAASGELTWPARISGPLAADLESAPSGPVAERPGASVPDSGAGSEDDAIELRAVEIDLSELLRDMQGSVAPIVPTPVTAPVAAPGPVDGAPPLDAVFEGFRSEVAEQADGDAAQQHERGIRLLQEGRFAEGVQALESAVRAPHFRFAAASRLGRAWLARGDAARGIEWLERAADAPAATPQEQLALLYDLGDALERTGEAARALAVFLELEANAGVFRDVAARIERLSRVQAGG